MSGIVLGILEVGTTSFLLSSFLGSTYCIGSARTIGSTGLMIGSARTTGSTGLMIRSSRTIGGSNIVKVFIVIELGALKNALNAYR